MNISILQKNAISGCLVAAIMSFSVSAQAQIGTSADYYSHQKQSAITVNCTLPGAGCAIPISNHGCRIFTATAEGDGLEHTQNLVRNALFNMLDSRGLKVTMTSVIEEPRCIFLEVGNKVSCDIEASICN